MSVANKEILLELRGVKTFFPIRSGFFNKITDHVKAVNDIDLDIYRGETLGLVGESGCGKTTLGKSIIQLVHATDGTMMYDFGESGGGKKDLRKLSKEDEQMLHKRAQIVFQDPYSSLNPSFTIFQSLADPLRHFGVKDKEEQRKIIGDILEAVNMRREYMDRYPHEFSGGQRQRIGIARALCVNPEMVVCDEAVSALDVSIQAQVLNLLMKLKEERNLTYIFITHNLSVVEYISDRIAVMYLGKIVELADTEQIFDNTMHPYTEALLSAIPIVDPDHKHSRIVLEGDVPNPVRPPDGCLFHPRCKKCMEICKKERPKLIKHTVEGKDHFCACHLYDNGVAQKG
ncbi:MULTISPECIES: ABC transporter ATP-binding protein [unclassified Anaerotruncus]|jgi:oligopeptide/dipeptide ABC transporter ATP-binding protein|uniref:ABC transporter ATP-binding protein n=1 Tax=unclassified Anaerotruncus TaxID=2641626 RepID=UPI00033862A8|nr:MULTISPECIES: ABC transporter ATP-binding protein [unclassified Anaerotruncus]MCI9160086.1 ABC transporter ATP-binding protein [Anaerotruncus sp.]NCE74672.1 ABC transporter ATP-binding protein [Anaerotruncus sp. X29]RKJ94790.1 ABC transporter ATP-binding protein [Anaerotruncus sp. 1XD22-93]EOS64145.1 oligopeptide/dipeptide ABC transporter, ATP-binding protein domain [Anaerotruncus sp. G3(2012)]MCI9234544.1 ABC transporter ATP-binding protein [Anaerotruncus sp.]